MKTKILSTTWQLLKKSGIEFANDGALKLGASLSYYTVFSLPPLLLIVISLCGVFFGPEAVRGEIYGQISYLVGEKTALQVQEIIRNVALSKDTLFATIIGIITLIIGASGVFGEIQDSINHIWSIKAKPNRGLSIFLRNRLVSFSMIVVIGFLLLVSLVLNALVDHFNNRLQIFFPQLSIHLFFIINLSLLFLIISLLFAIIFKTLPDGKVAWKDALIGSSFAATLFIIGKAGIGYYLGSSSIVSAYGAAGSLIIMLLWVYYSALILYFGAEFTKVYAFTLGSKIIPNNYAVHIERHEVEKKHLSPSQEPKALTTAS